MSAIDDIKERIDIVELIESNGVALRRGGRNLVGFCPFHANTRTPSFTVFPDTQSFYCFGCQASGTAFDFLMRKQGLDFREALEQLAARAGVQLEPQSADQREQDQQRTRLLEINAAAARYFNYVLVQMPRGQAGRDYVAQRGLGDAVIESFQLGYSLEDWSHLLRYLTDRKGFDVDEVVAAGLAIQRDDGGHYDRFRGRLIFPIRNARGEVVGFGGRALGDAQPKYLNTPQTLLFDKRSVLYGLDLARDTIRGDDVTVVVEGYIDVITAHQHGFRNVVAPLGTALTKDHVALLKKLSRNVYLALDADAAGQRATLRGLNVIQEGAEEDGTTRLVATAQGAVRLESDVTLRIITMPAGEDPDSVIRADAERWRTLVAEATPVMEFYISTYTAELDLSQPQAQRTALDRLLPLLRELDSTQQRVYIAHLEKVLGLRAELILDLLRGDSKGQRRDNRQSDRHHPPRQVTEANAGPADSPARNGREDYLLGLALRYPATIAAVEELLTSASEPVPQIGQLLGNDLASLLSQPANGEIWRQWQATPTDQRPLTEDGIVGWVGERDPLLHAQATRLFAVVTPEAQEYRYRQEAEQCARQIRDGQTRRWQQHLAQQAEAATTDDERDQTILTLQALQQYLRTLSTPRRSSVYTDLRDALGEG